MTKGAYLTPFLRGHDPDQVRRSAMANLITLSVRFPELPLDTYSDLSTERMVNLNSCQTSLRGFLVLWRPQAVAEQ
jgi:hypothetical protein